MTREEVNRGTEKVEEGWTRRKRRLREKEVTRGRTVGVERKEERKVRGEGGGRRKDDGEEEKGERGRRREEEKEERKS